MGYAKVNRNIVDTEIFYDDTLLSFYIRLILLARIKPCYDHGILVDKGQIFTSVRKLGSVLNYKSTNTFKLLNTLEEKHLISIENYSSGSLITILNYECEKVFDKNREQQKKCSREHFTNTSRTATLLYNKKEKNVKQGAFCARGQNANFENPAENAPEISENLQIPDQNLPDKSEKFSAITRELLVEKYGEGNVLDYEARFERWKSRQKNPVLIPCYEAIERWMRDDKVETVEKKSSEAAFNTEDIMQRIIDSYNS